MQAHFDDEAHMDRTLGNYGQYYNRILQAGRTVFKKGDYTRVNGFKSNSYRFKFVCALKTVILISSSSYRFIFVCALKPLVKVMSNIHLLTFYIFEAISNVSLCYNKLYNKTFCNIYILS